MEKKLNLKAHSKSIEELSKLLKTNLFQGLNKEEVKKRIKKTGLNKLPEAKQETWLEIFFNQFKSPLIYVLLAAGILVSLIGHWIDAIVICFVLILNAIIGTVQEGRASNILQSLKKILSLKCTVLRDGQKQIINTEFLVPGDIIILQEGERVPADSRIIKENELKVDESILTGESEAVSKSDEILAEDVALYQKNNMLFNGTYILSGQAEALVVKTGLKTEIGKIYQDIDLIETSTPLKKQIHNLSKFILIAASFLCILLFFIGFLNGKSISELFLITTSLFVAVIPEGFPAILTIILTVGANQLAKNNVLIKRLQAVEGLGRADVILMDKTGTLTRNEMMVLKIFVGSKEFTVTGDGYYPEGEVLFDNQPINKSKEYNELFLLGYASMLLDNSIIDFNEETSLFYIKGEPLEAAMGIFAKKLGLNKESLKEEYEKLHEIPFDSKSKLHLAIFEKDFKKFLFAVGAPESIIDSSEKIYNSAFEAFDNFLSQGLRVIGLAYQEIESDVVDIESFLENKKWFGKLKFLGFLGIQDAIRSDVRSMVDKARDSGLEIIVVTGDHKKTAEYVATETGILKKSDKIISGEELSKISDDDLKKDLYNIRVYSRVSPKEKMKIVKFFRNDNKIVAMIGDGVNDVPSILAADLGIAMGIKGTEVAKESADMILLDDSFSSIVKAIELGRHIFYTLRRVILYLLATNLGEVLVIIFSFIFFRIPLPILPAQILWLNIVTDGFLDLGLSMEKKEKDILEYGWLKKLQKTGLIDISMVIKIFYFALIMAIGSLFIFNIYYKYDLAKARTVTLLAMAAFQWFNALNCRSERHSAFSLGLFSNRWLLGAFLIVILAQIAVTYVPFMQIIFKTVSIGLTDWILAIFIASSTFIFEEIFKFVKSKIY